MGEADRETTGNPLRAPGPQALEDARRTVDTFLTLNTELVLGIALDEIDLADLVTQQPTAELLRQAAECSQSAWNSGPTQVSWGAPSSTGRTTRYHCWRRTAALSRRSASAMPPTSAAIQPGTFTGYPLVR